MRKNHTNRHAILAIALIALCASLFVADASAQTVLKRARLGNNTEDMEFIKSGRYANRLAILDGYDVITLPAKGHGHGGVQKLFDLNRLPIIIRPTGMAYVESEQLFVFNDLAQPGLIFSDEEGNPRGTRAITFPAGLNAIFGEALTYIRPNSPFFPDHLMEVVYDEGFIVHVLVIRRDGEVVHDIVLEDAFQQGQGVCGLAFAGPDRLLVGTCINQFFFTDLEGHIVEGPVVLDSAGSAEGLAQLNDGRFVATANEGKVLYFDRNLNRLPKEDQSYKIGLGLSRPFAPSWNPDTNEIMFISLAGPPSIEAVPVSLDSRRQIVDLAAPLFNPFNTSDLTYLPDEQRIGLASSRAPRGIFLYDNSGAFHEYINTTPVGSPVRARYLSATQQFATMLRGAANFNLIKIVNRMGVYERTIDLNPFGIIEVNLEYYDPAHPTGGKLLVMDSASDALILDLNGTLLSRFPYRQPLDLPFGVAGGVTAITTGQYAGAFAAVNVNNSEVVIFKLD
ncbi:MAG: hypothetical protein AABN95_24840 [Acidobacteriota bacterium]